MHKILFIGAHPDDVELGCGGTIYKYSKLGASIKVLVLAEGSSSRFSEDTDFSIVEQEINKRQHSCKVSLQNLGVNEVEFHNLPCGRLDSVSILDINKIIENTISNFQPDTVFTHSDKDTNLDHRIVFSSTKIATRPSAFPFIRRVCSYEVLSSTECAFNSTFQPNMFISLDKEDVDSKIRSLQQYETEMRDFPHPRSIEGVRVLANYRGMQVFKRCAEAFEVLRSVS